MCDIMAKSVAIVGAGKMGLWFCNYFSKKIILRYYCMIRERSN
jgi:prephenate dehydrogenase